MNRKIETVLIIVCLIAMLAVFAFAPGRRDPGKRDIEGTTWHPTATSTRASLPDEQHAKHLSPEESRIHDLTAFPYPTQAPYGGWHLITATPDGSGTPTPYSYP